MLPNPLYAQCVTQAAQLLGGLDRLARELYLAPRILERWVDGRSTPPTVVFLRLVDILLGDDVPTGETRSLRTQDYRKNITKYVKLSPGGHLSRGDQHPAPLSRNGPTRCQPLNHSACTVGS